MVYLDFTKPLVKKVQQILAAIEKREELDQMKRNFLSFKDNAELNILNGAQPINLSTFKKILEKKNKKLKSNEITPESEKNLLENEKKFFEIPFILFREVYLAFNSMQRGSDNILLKAIKKGTFDVTGRLKIGCRCMHCWEFLGALYLTPNIFGKFDSVTIMNYNQETNLVTIAIGDSSLPSNQLIFSFIFNSDFSCKLYEIDTLKWYESKFMLKGYCCIYNNLIPNYRRIGNNALTGNKLTNKIKINCSKKNGYFTWFFSNDNYWIELKLNIWNLYLWIKLQK